MTDKRNELISLLVVVDLFLPAVKEYCVPGLRGSGHSDWFVLLLRKTSLASSGIYYVIVTLTQAINS